MSDKLIELIDPALIQSGVTPALHPLQSPLWVECQNVLFEDGQVKKNTGYIELLSFSDVAGNSIIGMIDLLRSDAPLLIYADYDALRSWDGTDMIEEATGYSGVQLLGMFQPNGFQTDAFQMNSARRATLWSLESWGSWCVASNGVGLLQINKTTGGGFANLAGTPPAYAQVIKRLGTYMLAFNTDLGSEYFEWCDTDNVEQWATGAAGNLPIRDLDSEIIAAQRMGSVIGVYSQDCMAVVQYIGPPFYFGAKVVLRGIGATGKLCVVEREQKNYGLSRKGFWETDGTQYRYISPPLMRDWLDRHVNWGSAEKVAGFVNEDRSLIEWGVPIDGASEPNINICFNYDTETWSFKKLMQFNLDYGFNLGISSALRKGVFAYPIVATPDGYLMYAEIGQDIKKDSLWWRQESFVISKPMPLKDIRQWKSLDYFIARFKDLNTNSEVDTVNVYLGVSETVDGTITWSTAMVANETAIEQYLQQAPSLDGKFISIKIVSGDTSQVAGVPLLASPQATFSGTDWCFSGIEVWGIFTGSSS